MNTPMLVTTRHMILAVLVTLTLGSPRLTLADTHPRDGLTPIVLFPGMFGSRLLVEVKNQTAFPECPRSGTFTVMFVNNTLSTDFSQICQDKLFTLLYSPDHDRPMPQRFANPHGVEVKLLDYGKTQSVTPGLYEGLFAALEAAGYQRDQNLRVADYDSRLTPDMGGFLERTIELIEDTYRENHNTPVHLVGHSNGPLYAQYLLTHTSPAWKRKYIHGFTSLSGNLPGQGSTYSFLFTGININPGSYPTDAENARSSSAMWRSFPATYMSSAAPEILGDKEVVVQDQSTGKSYTPKYYPQLLKGAGLSRLREIADYYIGFVKFADPAWFPNVDVYAEKGSGFDTTVGIQLPNLQVGRLVTDQTVFFTLPGDINQEDLTNNAILAWHAMACYHFEFNDNPGVNHFALPAAPGVVRRLLTDLKRSASVCR